MAELKGRVALLSDVHGNMEALEAVLDDIAYRNAVAKRKANVKPIAHIWFLGDAVGYGPQPLECFERVMQVCDPGFVLAGNHELATRTKINTPSIGLSNFFTGKGAEEGIHWTVRQLYGCDAPIERTSEGKTAKEAMEKLTQELLNRVQSPNYLETIADEHSRFLRVKARIPLSIGDRFSKEIEVPQSAHKQVMMDPHDGQVIRDYYKKIDIIDRGHMAAQSMQQLPVKINSIQGVMLVHDNHVNPGDMKYLLDAEHQQLTSNAYLIDDNTFAQLKEQGINRLFFGHSHIPGIYKNKNFPGIVITNVGSVGLPRENFVATYCIWNPEADGDVRIIELDMAGWEKTRDKAIKAGLPDKLSKAYESAQRKEARYID
ncbi:MAG: metallophosphoesterase [Candidatus Woesearchaeota archaeon]